MKVTNEIYPESQVLGNEEADVYIIPPPGTFPEDEIFRKTVQKRLEKGKLLTMDDWNSFLEEVEEEGVLS